MPDVIYHDDAPRRHRRFCEFRLTVYFGHPVDDDLRPVLREVSGPQHGDCWQRPPASESADRESPERAVDGTVQRVLFLAQCHPVVLQQVVAYQMPNDCQCQGVLHIRVV